MERDRPDRSRPSFRTWLVRRFVLVLAGSWIAAGWSSSIAHAGDPKPAGTASSAESVEFFETRVRPVLVERCVKCHGPQKQSGGLRLDSRDALLKGGDSGPALVPAKPEESLDHPGGLVSERRAEDAAQGEAARHRRGVPVAMGVPGRPLAGRQGQERDGRPSTAAGDSPAHWAFRPIRRAPLPRVKNQGWVRSPIDAHVLARLEAQGITPSPPAEKRTLIRRATIDLWGIPPTAEEVEAFEADRVSRRLRPRGRPAPGLAAIWRALGTALARRRPLCRHQGLRLHPGPPISLLVHLSRLRDPRLQRRPGVTIGSSSSSSPPTSSPDGGDTRPLAAHGLPDGRPPVPPRPERDHRRPDRRGQPRLARPDGHLRPLPRPQVRPDPDRGLLLALRRLRQLGRAGRAAPCWTGRRRQGREVRRVTSRSWRCGQEARSTPTWRRVGTRSQKDCTARFSQYLKAAYDLGFDPRNPKLDERALAGKLNSERLRGVIDALEAAPGRDGQGARPGLGSLARLRRLAAARVSPPRPPKCSATLASPKDPKAAPIHPLVARVVLASPPSSMAEVVARYVALFGQLEAKQKEQAARVARQGRSTARRAGVGVAPAGSSWTGRAARRHSDEPDATLPRPDAAQRLETLNGAIEQAECDRSRRRRRGRW